MAAAFQFEHTLPFDPGNASGILRQIPTLPGVFALFGADAPDGQPSQPYLTRAAELRRRITRILAPPEPSPDGTPAPSKRLNLRDRVVRIAYTVTGSEFESTLLLYHAASGVFGFAEARRRLKLHTPFFLRFTAENAHPRVYSTNRLGKRSLAHTYGPFPSRTAAERYCDAVLDLFKLRRCYEDLAPFPGHPGCAYGEMKKCLAPCNQAHTGEGAAAYSAEAAAVKRFFDTRGESMIVDLGREREEASAAMQFERAAALHGQWQKVKSVQALASELVQPVPSLRAVIVQKQGAGRDDRGAEGGEADPAAAVFLLQGGWLAGPARLSTLGVRAVKEQTSVGSSLFAQPLMLQAVPLPSSSPPTASDQSSPSSSSHTAPEQSSPPSSSTTAPQQSSPTSSSHTAADQSSPPSSSPSAPQQSSPFLSSRSAAEGSASPDAAPEALPLSPELRAAHILAALESTAVPSPDLATLSDHLSLLRRWYYRPEKQRAGEVFLPNPDGSWPIRRILRGAARMALGEPTPMAETQRDLAARNPEDAAVKPGKTRILHEGRPDVERIVHIVDQAALPGYTSRRKA